MAETASERPLSARVERILALSEEIEALGTTLRPGALGTREEWEAWSAMRYGANSVRAAGVWLARHEER